MRGIGKMRQGRRPKCILRTLRTLRTLCIVGTLCAAVCACGVRTGGQGGGPEDDPGEAPQSGETGQEAGQETGQEGCAGTEGDAGMEAAERSFGFISGAGSVPGRQDYHLEAFGGNVYFFAPEDDPEEVQRILEEIWEKQERNQFGDARYAVYFLPGTYEDAIRARVGFYTQIAGLGVSPDDVSLYNLTCDARWLGDYKNHNATCNFWRGAENLSVREYVTWAVSQATFLRRVHIGKTIYLHDGNGWASGGFLANSRIELAVNSGPQQQWLSRNCDWSAWRGENWNMVFAGIEEGKTPEGTWPEHAYTDVPVVERIREKPFLAYDRERGFGVYVPGLRTEAVGVDWDPGTFLPMDDFYIARAGTDTAETMNRALQEGKHLFLTPGIYEVEEPLAVERENTVVLGTGLATLRSVRGNSCMEIRGAGATVAGILFDAGEERTMRLFSVEKAPDKENAGAVTLLADLFFRVGGAKSYATEVDCCVEIGQDGVVGDNFWVWRADHGDGVGWNRNRARNGIRVTGDDVTVYALMVEHFQEYQTIWEGERGQVIFYQSEIPYDVPGQEQWVSHDGAVNGFASYKVADHVETHAAYGLGIYLYNRDAEVELHSAMEVPADAEGIHVHHICTVMITGHPGITHIINEQGEAAVNAGSRAILIDF